MRRSAITLLLAILILTSGPAVATRIVAMGDVHGEINGFRAVLRAAGLIDDEGRWAGGATILVQTGDLTDRGVHVRAVLDLMMDLEEQAPQQGGRVVGLLGNHEMSNLSGWFDEYSTPAGVYREIWAAFADDDSERRQRRAFKKWRRWRQRYPICAAEMDRDQWAAEHPPGFLEYQEALSPNGVYGRWLRGKPVAAEIDGNVFVHGGLSPALLERGIDSVDELNAEARRALEQFDADRRELAVSGMIPDFATLDQIYCAVDLDLALLRSVEEPSPQTIRRLRELEAIRQRLPGAPGFFLSEEAGPLWYRGLALDDEEEAAQAVVRILDAFGARRLVVGHTPTRGKIHARFGGRVILIDTAMVYGAEVGGRGSALELNGDSAVAIYTDGREPLGGDEAQPEAAQAPAVEGTNGHDRPAIAGGNGQEQPARADEDGGERSRGGRRWLDPDGNPLPFTHDEEILEFLRSAKIVDRRPVGSGVTRPDLLLLERAGIHAHAIFHDVDVEKTRQRLSGGQVVMFFRDSYLNNVAAYELSRLLELDNVPPAVVRRIAGAEGSVQMWIEGGNDETDRRRLGVVPPGHWRLAWDDMWIFDNLINNIDRNQGNILYDSEWKLWFIDHTRAFGREKKLPLPDRVRRCSRRLWGNLIAADEDVLRETLDPYMGTYEIRGLLARREALRKRLDELIRERGEHRVLLSYDETPAAVKIEEIEGEIPPEPPGG